MNLFPITAVILAGGQAKRMEGKDKGLVTLFGKPLYQHVSDKLLPYVSQIVISANRNLSSYQQSGYPVVTDIIGNFAGPLAGMLTGLTYSQTDWVLFAPCDTPFIPDNLVTCLWHNKNGHNAVYVHDGMREHPTLCLLNKKLVPDLRLFLANGDKKLMLFLQKIDARPVYFKSDANAFNNLNTLDDCRALEHEGKGLNDR